MVNTDPIKGLRSSAGTTSTQLTNQKPSEIIYPSPLAGPIKLEVSKKN